MTPNPIHKVLSTLQTNRVDYLLMGGQACVLYGAAEFSRDTDIVLLAEEGNLTRLRSAIDELDGECIAVPPFDQHYLQRGHAVHFRCHHQDAAGTRLDVMSVLRNVAPFPALWSRRTTVTTLEQLELPLLSLPDLVQAKKTQRDKDWLMLRRLILAHYEEHRQDATPARMQFWLLEGREPEFLTELADRFKTTAEKVAQQRPLLTFAIEGDRQSLAAELQAEEEAEREADRQYWLPLRRELETLRHERLRDPDA